MVVTLICGYKNKIQNVALFSFKGRDRTWSLLGGDVGGNLVKLGEEAKYDKNILNEILKEKCYLLKI